MKKVLVAVLGLIVVVSTACPPPVSATQVLDLGPAGTWTSPTAAITGSHSSGQFAEGSNASISITATVSNAEEARLVFRIESTTTVPEISVGTYDLRAFDPLTVLFIKMPDDDPRMSLDGSITVSDVAYGAPTTSGDFITRPITRLRATFTARFDEEATPITGAVSIG